MADRPRFIAGAVCPNCGALDRTLVEATESGKRRRCVECGDAQNEAGGGPGSAPGPMPGPIKGRLDRPTGRQTSPRPVKLVDGARKPKSK